MSSTKKNQKEDTKGKKIDTKGKEKQQKTKKQKEERNTPKLGTEIIVVGPVEGGEKVIYRATYKRSNGRIITSDRIAIRKRQGAGRLPSLKTKMIKYMKIMNDEQMGKTIKYIEQMLYDSDESADDSASPSEDT